MSQPDPARHRRPPPPRSLVALTGDLPGDRTVILHLLDQTEESELRSILEAAGWRVVSAEDYGTDLTAAIENHPRIVLTDDPSLPASLPEEWQTSRPPVVTLVDDRQSAVTGAWSAGADWVITRPIDPDDPFGVEEFGGQIPLR